MNNDRDMYYGNYGYTTSGPFPNQMGFFPNQMGFFPNVNPYNNMNSMMPCSGNNNQNNPNYNNTNYNNDIDSRLNIMERQIRRLNDRVTRLEASYSNNTTNIYNEPDSSMYMM